MPIERKVIERNITEKGFVYIAGGDHDYYWLYDQGKKTKWWIRLSRGSNYKEYSDALLKRQARLLHIPYSDLKKFIDCTHNKEEFISILKDSDKS